MSAGSELDRLRAEMDAVDARLSDALHDRARLCRAIGAWKSAHGLPAFDPERERRIRAALLARTPDDGFAAGELATILDVVLGASRRLVDGDRS